MLLTARRTLSRSCSKLNSGVCTPITSSPASRYFAAQAHVRHGAKPVHAGVGPELDEQHLAAKLRGAERLGIEPGARPFEACGEPLVFGARGCRRAEGKQPAQQQRASFS